MLLGKLQQIYEKVYFPGFLSSGFLLQLCLHKQIGHIKFKKTLLVTTKKKSTNLQSELERIPANIYLFKVNNINNRKRSEICSKLTIKTPETTSMTSSGVFIRNFEHISHLLLVILSLTLKQ